MKKARKLKVQEREKDPSLDFSQLSHPNLKPETWNHKLCNTQLLPVDKANSQSHPMVKFNFEVGSAHIEAT